MRSESGFTIIELLVSLAIASVVAAGLLTLALSSSRVYLAQNGVIAMQADGRAALEYMVRDLRLAYGTPTLSTTVTTNDTITFHRVDDSGYSSGANTSTVLKDTAKAWTASQFAPSATSAYTLRLIAGTGSGQTRTISDNTATQLTVATAWATTPDTTSHYVITSERRFTRTSSTDHLLRYRVGASGTAEPLGENITSLAFALSGTNSLTITLTARTKNVDAATNQYRYYTLSETIRRRNT